MNDYEQTYQQFKKSFCMLQIEYMNYELLNIDVFTRRIIMNYAYEMIGFEIFKKNIKKCNDEFLQRLKINLITYKHYKRETPYKYPIKILQTPYRNIRMLSLLSENTFNYDTGYVQIIINKKEPIIMHYGKPYGDMYVTHPSECLEKYYDIFIFHRRYIQVLVQLHLTFNKIDRFKKNCHVNKSFINLFNTKDYKVSIGHKKINAFIKKKVNIL